MVPEFGSYDVQIGDSEWYAHCNDVLWYEVDAALKGGDAANYVMTEIVQYLWHVDSPKVQVDKSRISARTYRKIHRAIISDFQNLS